VLRRADDQARVVRDVADEVVDALTDPRFGRLRAWLLLVDDQRGDDELQRVSL